MGSSIFADESGDESVREERGDGRPPSVFRRRRDDEGGRADDSGETTDGDERTDDDARREPDAGARRAYGDDDESTMTVFSGDEVYEVVVDDAE
ncbi:hypothetical protein [Halorubellus sp. PRR65]|uniref:hypothetical protein n=1 Tax=Halorubellus sp. PRR65 TaxID=3098148 RepID=UPI002B25C295|nr:hypothetical protein [Halorubellus sp. PRR65]